MVTVLTLIGFGSSTRVRGAADMREVLLMVSGAEVQERDVKAGINSVAAACGE
jgi:hypothetical protein